MYTIRKEFHFSSSHQLKGLPPEHPCSHLHGHNYVVIMELRSKHLNNVGFVRDYRALQPVKDFLDDTWDHRHLNDLMECNPTAENMAFILYTAFKSKIPELQAVEVMETPKTCARYEAY